MFSIPYGFKNEDESYITIPALKRFAKERKDNDLKTTIDRRQLISDIETYARQSEENLEDVLDWIDHVLIEGIKEVHIKFIDVERSRIDLLLDKTVITDILEPKLIDKNRRHLCNAFSSEIKLFRYDYLADEYGTCIRLYLGKILSTYDKQLGPGKCLYPICVEVYVDKEIIVARSKSKTGIYTFMEDFILEDASTTTAEKEMKEAIQYVRGLLNIGILSEGKAYDKFRNQLFYMLVKYTGTPKEINDLIDSKKIEIASLVDRIMNEICNLPKAYTEDVNSNVNNMIEKYFSISYPNKSIFIKDRDAYPLKLNATDEEESKVEQTSALEEPLQSKAIFFDNKKMLQKSELCDGVWFMFYRKNTLYCNPKFRVKIFCSKNDFCTLKFTEYTMEEDIKHVLFSLINASRDTI